MVKIRKLKWYGHIVRNKGALRTQSCNKKSKEVAGEEDQAENPQRI